MALELGASRFVAPYFGTSMIVWANIIGMILLCLSLGYWFGGRLADRFPDGRLLMLLSLCAGMWSSLLPWFGKLLFSSMSSGILNTPIHVILISFFSILIAFAPPVFLLAMASPFAIRIVDAPPEKIGKTAGNLYAFSTIGSLLGTFGTAFLTIPLLGTQQTLWSASVMLLLISAIGLCKTKKGWIAFVILVLPIGLYLGMRGPEKVDSGVVFAKDTLYQYVQVQRNKSGDTFLIYNEGGGVQSIHRRDDALSPSDYYDDYLMLPYLIHPQTEDRSAPSVLVLGSAGGTIPHLMNVYDRPAFPKMQVTGVEIDGQVIPLDYRYFGLKQADASILNEDARSFVRSTQNKYDIVVVDAYSQQIYIPFHLSTVEFFQQVQHVLTPVGLVALNVNAISPDSKLLTSMEKTVSSVFPYTYRMKARGEYNYVIVGSIHPITSIPALSADNPITAIASEWQIGMQRVTNAATMGGLRLTDNRAPVEMLTDSMIFGVATRQ